MKMENEMTQEEQKLKYMKQDFNLKIKGNAVELILVALNELPTKTNAFMLREELIKQVNEQFNQVEKSEPKKQD
jgi:protein associated with RNAse G/E